ncbi:NAD(P)/FAD-dependent oxidoreductase [Vreelandella boliviensis]|jgi:glycine/D-amino acid oxidase-like deaminating enzyme|uniref:NAD(P)/FAD-dependent oxidoreductase n=1 Tax=Vreelandella boliviensis TaxID=223527 RepID=UPI001B8BC7AE|nr:FAD-dependent oxidoreductase [Halomonas boliviensis]MBS3669681.1 FAD-dependent oxidoreductase [Halomonas boliviensis]
MPHTTHPSHQRPCGWNAWLAERQPRPALRGHSEANVVIIGAGYTGFAAASAWQQARPDDRIKILEADRIGEGSPGRNSGFMLEIALANDARPEELERMEKLNALSRQTMALLRERVERLGIDCQLERSGTYRAARSGIGQRALRQYEAFLKAAGLSYQTLNANQLAERIGTRYYTQGIYSPDCYLVQPAALIVGLADSLEAGIELHEHSPATQIVPDGKKWRVITPEGEVTAGQVILANNAFSRALGADPSRLTAIYTYAAITEPLPEPERQRIAATTWGLLPAHRLGCTLRTTADGRLMIRSRYSYEREADNARIEAELKASLEARYPELTPVHFDKVWGGTTGLTYNGAPLWGEIQPGLYVSAGCNGGGIVKGTFLGDALARYALGQPVEDIASLFGKASWMPPDPVRRLGFYLTSEMERRKAKHET